MQQLTLEQLKNPPDRRTFKDVPLPNGTVASFQAMLEGERLAFESRNMSDAKRRENLRGLLVANCLLNGEGLMLSEEDVMTPWWYKQDATLVTAMFSYCVELCGFDKDDVAEMEDAAKN